MTVTIKLPTNDYERQGFCLRAEDYGLVFDAEKTTGTKLYWQYIDPTLEEQELQVDLLPSLGDSFDEENESVVAYGYRAKLHEKKKNILIWNVIYSNNVSDLIATQSNNIQEGKRTATSRMAQLNGVSIPEITYVIEWKYKSWDVYMEKMEQYSGKVGPMFGFENVLFTGGSANEVALGFDGGNMIKTDLIFVIRPTLEYPPTTWISTPLLNEDGSPHLRYYVSFSESVNGVITTFLYSKSQWDATVESSTVFNLTKWTTVAMTQVLDTAYSQGLNDGIFE